MKEEFINQFNHFWKTFDLIVNDFNESSWNEYGYGLIIPSRTSFHIIKSTKDYMKDKTAIKYKSGKVINENWSSIEEKDFPSIEDLSFLIMDMKIKTKQWLDNLDFESENIDFKWTGNSKLSIVIFLMKHSYFHLGEINCLLNEQEKGKAKDNFVNSV
ncbi:MAG: hypothetical protein PF637_11455 [Spirochaetes bacterium]|nr:hypothetical protein [Spirochaetota bacterium]